MRATPADMDQWIQDAGQLHHDRCLEYYGPNGTIYRAQPYIFDDDILFNESKQIQEPPKQLWYHDALPYYYTSSHIRMNRTYVVVCSSLVKCDCKCISRARKY